MLDDSDALDRPLVVNDVNAGGVRKATPSGGMAITAAYIAALGA